MWEQCVHIYLSLNNKGDNYLRDVPFGKSVKSTINLSFFSDTQWKKKEKKILEITSNRFQEI